MSPLNSRALSIYIAAALSISAVAPSFATAAPSVANNATIASAASAGVTASAISSMLSSANYINLRNSVISTNLVAPLYRARGNEPIFVSGNAATANLAKLKLLVSQVHLLGLDSEDYWNGELESLSAQLQNSQAALEFELLAAQSLVNIASDVATGRAVLRSIDLETDFRKSAFDGYQTLNQILSSNDLLSSMEQFEPQQDQYRQLSDVLKKLYSIKAGGGWKSISGADLLKPGMTSSDVSGIRQRLADLNYLSADERNNPSNKYDSALVAAVKLFQAGMNLDADGVCGKNCFIALKTSIDKRIAQVNVNLERWRWLPKNLGTKYVFVNLARQELRVWENGVQALAMKTVNGRLLRRTPTMVDRIYEVIFNPYWTVPDSIAFKDVIPKQKADPFYMNNENIRVIGADGTYLDPATVDWSAIGSRIPYNLRQDPGPHNSLGTVKFSLTNSRSIYLHDTPHQEDFPTMTRLKSSGCVRLEHPHDLAEYLLQGTEWTRDRMDAMYVNYLTYPAYSVKLKQSIPTYLTYLTASVGDQGEIQFTPDYYGQDERLINVSKNKEGY